jgi:hypothetical protein
MDSWVNVVLDTTHYHVFHFSIDLPRLQVVTEGLSAWDFMRTTRRMIQLKLFLGLKVKDISGMKLEP